MKKSILTICVFFAILISNNVFGQTDSTSDHPFVLATGQNTYGRFDYSKNDFNFVDFQNGDIRFYVYKDSIISDEIPTTKFYVIKELPEINDNGRSTLRFSCVDNNNEHCLFIFYADHNNKTGYVQVNYNTIAYKYVVTNKIF